MQIDDFRNTCTAVIFSGLQRCNTETGGVAATAQRDGTLTLDMLHKEVLRFKRDGRAMAIAITCNEQKEAQRVLRKFGFRSSAYMRSTNHNTLTKLWYYPLQDYVKPQDK